MRTRVKSRSSLNYKGGRGGNGHATAGLTLPPRASKLMKIRKIRSGTRKIKNFDAPEASRSHFGSLRAPTWLARGLRRPQGLILGGIFDDFCFFLEVFPHVVLHGRIIMNSVAFTFRAEMADTRNFAYVPRQNVFFQDTRLRRRRR